MKTTEIVFRNENGVPVTTSVIVAEYFEKNHKHVMEAIQDIIATAEKSAIVELQELKEYFELSSYETMMPGNTGAVRKYPMYIMNEEGFTHLAMGFTGEKAKVFKQRYIKAFKAMRNVIQQGLSLSEKFMESQTRTLQTVTNTCERLMDRLDRMEQSFAMGLCHEAGQSIYLKPAPRFEPMSMQPSISKDGIPTVLNEGEAPSAHNGQLWNKCVMSYGELRTYYPDYKNTHDVAEELRRRGIHIYQRGLFSYLREKGYLSDGVYTFNRPSEECARNRYMVATVTGRNGRTGRHRGFVPYHSPAFIDILEKEMCEIRSHVQQPYLPFNEPGKEVQG